MNTYLYLERKLTELLDKMFKFFRRIRRQLAYENQLLKYLRYAIGEIILVVIGILIALQINQWNEERKNKNLMVDLFNEIKLDLENDIIYLEEGIQSMESQIAYKTWGLNRSDYHIKDRDSINWYLTASTFDRAIITKGYDKLISSGLTRFHQYEELNKEISGYYTVHKSQYDNWIQWNKTGDNQDRLLLKDSPHVYEIGLGKFPPLDPIEKRDSIKIEHLKWPVFRNVSRIRYYRYSVLLKELTRMQQRSIALKKRIEESVKE